jgi:hypothetical protein
LRAISSISTCTWNFSGGPKPFSREINYKKIRVTRNFDLYTCCSAAILLSVQIPHAANAGDDLQDQYVGSETCMECHEDYYASYMKNRHAVKADPRTPAAGWGCEACHGPGAEHAESEGEDCLTCHTPMVRRMPLC